MKRIKKIRQHDITDCGAACLTSIASYYGKRIDLARIRQFAHTDKSGTNVLGLLEAANKIGFAAKGVKGGFNSLLSIPLPAIAHIIVNKNYQHYVVLYKINKRYVWVMDPAFGQLKKVLFEVFCSEWTGVLIILTPLQDFQKNGEISFPC